MKHWKYLRWNRLLILLLFGTIILFTAQRTVAQVPKYGIYQLYKNIGSVFPATYYTKYLNNIGEYFEVNTVPDKEILKYNLAYALVAVDSAKGIMRVAFLPDSVSKAGKKKWNDLSDFTNRYPRRRKMFTQEFKISGDSILRQKQFDPSFPADSYLDGKVLFNKYTDYLCFVKLPPKRKSLQRYNAVTKTYKRGALYTFQQSFFTPFIGSGIRAFKNLIVAEGRIPIYKKPTKVIKPYNHFQPGEYIAVVKDSSNWLKIDRLVVVPDHQTYYSMSGNISKGHIKLRLIPGWVKVANVVPATWFKQKQQTKQFRFEVAASVTVAKDSYARVRGEVYAIKIINKKTGKVQFIRHIYTPLVDSLDNVVELQDANFDGYLDIQIFGHTGGAGPNSGFNFYLYDPKTGQFEYNKELSGLTQITIAPEAKRITSAFRDGCCHHGGETYTFKNGQLDTLSYWDNYWGPGYFGQYTKGKKVNGQWQDSTFYEATVVPDSVSLFSSFKHHTTPKRKLGKGDRVTILKEKPLRIEVRGTSYSGGKPAPFKGWIRKKAILQPKWQAFKSQTPKYRFSGSGSPPIAIKITDQGSGKTAQVILLYKPLYKEYSDSLLQTGDYNHDGTTDFRIERYSYSKKNKPAFTYFLFDKKEGKFKLSSRTSYEK